MGAVPAIEPNYQECEFTGNVGSGVPKDATNVKLNIGGQIQFFRLSAGRWVAKLNINDPVIKDQLAKNQANRDDPENHGFYLYISDGSSKESRAEVEKLFQDNEEPFIIDMVKDHTNLNFLKQVSLVAIDWGRQTVYDAAKSRIELLKKKYEISDSEKPAEVKPTETKKEVSAKPAVVKKSKPAKVEEDLDDEDEEEEEL